MNKLITNEGELQHVLTRVDNLLHAYSKGDKTVKDELDVLSLIIENYEDKTWQPIALSPQEFLTTYMQESGRTKADLAVVLGAQSRASEVMSGKRDLSKAHIKSLVEQWGLPATVLLGIKIQKAA